jgi:anti-sigma regulatory factor (Ser/Thr protein kinase)
MPSSALPPAQNPCPHGPTAAPALLTHRFPNSPTTPRQARDWLGGPLRAGPCAAIADDALLCLSELVGNAHRHTRIPAIPVRAFLTGRSVHVDVRDDRPEPLPVPPPGRLPEFGERGRGLTILEGCADSWGVTFFGGLRPTGKSVWFTLRTERG